MPTIPKQRVKIIPGPPAAGARVLTLKHAARGRAPRPRALIVGISRDLHDNRRVVPLAGGLLKTYADRELGGKCEVRTLNLYTFDYARTLDFIASWNPDIVAFSCYLWNLRKVESLCRRIRKKYPRKRIVLGGPEATGRKEEMLRKCGADALVLGEGEATFAELLTRFVSGTPWKGTPGALVRCGGAVHAGPSRDLIADIHSIPTPFRNADSTMGARRGSFLTFETMRGCPNKCTYCVWTELKARKLRFFSVKRVASDLCWMAQKTPTSVFVADSDLFLDHRCAMRLAPLFRAAVNGEIFYMVFQTNLNHWTGELMRAWNHEKYEINVGVNSVNPAVQAILGRNYSRKLVEKKLAQMHRLAPKTKITMQFMFAAPGETFSDFCESFDWAWRQPVTAMLFFHTQPLYGTQMRERSVELGIKCRNIPPYHIISTKECTAGEIKTEGLMILTVAVWMALPGSRELFMEMADSFFGGSLSAAFLEIWRGMSRSARRKALETWDYYNGGSDCFPDDFQLDLMYGYAPPRTKPFMKAVYTALSATQARLAGKKARA